LTYEFQFLSQHYSGVIALPATEDRTGRGYEFVKFTRPDIDLPDITWEDVWECMKKHYGFAVAGGFVGVAGISIDKVKYGYPVIGNASKKTNIVSHIGTKFFPMATLPEGSPVARLTKATL